VRDNIEALECVNSKIVIAVKNKNQKKSFEIFEVFLTILFLSEVALK
jgi:hypothetical protein